MGWLSVDIGIKEIIWNNFRRKWAFQTIYSVLFIFFLDEI